MKLEGKPIVNAKRPLVVEITRQDIRKGKRLDPENCVAAVALKREYGDKIPRVLVHHSRTYVDKGDHWVRYNTPVNVQKETIAFDRGAEFEAGNFRFLPPCPSEVARLEKQVVYKKSSAGRKSGTRGSPNRQLTIVRSKPPRSDK